MTGLYAPSEQAVGSLTTLEPYLADRTTTGRALPNKLSHRPPNRTTPDRTLPSLRQPLRRATGSPAIPDRTVVVHTAPRRDLPNKMSPRLPKPTLPRQTMPKRYQTNRDKPKEKPQAPLHHPTVPRRAETYLITLKYPNSDLQHPNSPAEEHRQEGPSFAFLGPRTRGGPEYGRDLSSVLRVPPGVSVVFLGFLSFVVL